MMDWRERATGQKWDKSHLTRMPMWYNNETIFDFWKFTTPNQLVYGVRKGLLLQLGSLTPTNILHKNLNILTINDLYKYIILPFVNDTQIGKCPKVFGNISIRFITIMTMTSKKITTYTTHQAHSRWWSCNDPMSETVERYTQGFYPV